MQLKDKSGIACDYCGATYRSDFDYYSWDFRHLQAHDNRRLPLDHIFGQHVIFSTDICSLCFGSFRDRIVANYKKVMSDKRQARVNQACDWTGTILAGTYDYYHVNIIQVVVRISGQPFVCTRCNTKSFDVTEKCAKCGAVELVKIAAVKTADRFLELTLSQAAFQEFTDKATSVRKIAGEWAAQ
jgi:ribosomal protein L40E